MSADMECDSCKSKRVTGGYVIHTHQLCPGFMADLLLYAEGYAIDLHFTWSAARSLGASPLDAARHP